MLATVRAPMLGLPGRVVGVAYPCADRAGQTDSQRSRRQTGRACDAVQAAGASRQSFRRNLHRSNRSLQCHRTGGKRARRRNSERKVRTPTAVASVPLVAERKLTSTGAVRLALEAGVDIVYLNSFGTPVGRIFSSSPKGIADLRKAQVVFSSSPKALELSRRLVAAKGTNQVAHLRQLARQYRTSFTREIVQCETMIDSLNLLDGDIQLAASY